MYIFAILRHRHLPLRTSPSQFSRASSRKHLPPPRRKQSTLTLSARVQRSIVGHKGSGKSTLIGLIAKYAKWPASARNRLKLFRYRRTQKVTRGTILVNGIDINSYDHAELHRLCSFTFQTSRGLPSLLLPACLALTHLQAHSQPVFLSPSAIMLASVVSSTVTTTSGSSRPFASPAPTPLLTPFLTAGTHIPPASSEPSLTRMIGCFLKPYLDRKLPRHSRWDHRGITRNSWLILGMSRTGRDSQRVSRPKWRW
jgi:hypothetical protein